MRPEKTEGAWLERAKEILSQETVKVVVRLMMLCCGLTMLVLASFLLGPYKLHYFTLTLNIFLAGPLIMIITAIPHIMNHTAYITARGARRTAHAT